MKFVLSYLKKLAFDFGAKKLALFFTTSLAHGIVSILIALAVTFLIGVIFSENKETVLNLGGYELRLSLVQVGIAFGVLQLLYLFMELVSSYIRVRYVSRFNAWLRVSTLNRILRFPYPFFADRSASVIQQTFNTYAIGIGNLINSVLDSFAKIFLILCFCGIAVYRAPLLSSIIAGLGIIYYLVLIKFVKKLFRNVSSKTNVIQTRLQEVSMQIVNGIKQLRISQKEGYYGKEYKENAIELTKYEAIRVMGATFPKPMLETILMLCVVAFVLFLGATQETNNFVGDLGVLMFVGYKVFPLMQNVYYHFTNVSTMAYLVERVASLDEQTPEEYLPEGQHLKFERSFEIQNLLFSYGEGKNEIQFPPISFKKGQIIGIRGESGSGKSTLLDILLGLQKAKSGKIIVDGQEVSDLQLRSLYPKIGYVGQDPFLLNTTIAENIALEDKDVDMSQLKKCCSLAQLDTFIENQPDGYQSIVGDRGVKLSGGQKQRIAIARALYTNPEILLLDEATSALDDATEKRIMETIYSLPSEMTILMIAHRLSTLKGADQVIEIG